MDVSNAEREASEVLHSLLSVPRVQTKETNDELKKESTSKVKWNLNEEHLYTVQPSSDDRLTSGETSEYPVHDETIASTTDVEANSSGTKTKKKLVKRKNTKVSDELNRIEDNAQAVRDRFQHGCDCSDDSCFRGLNPESVYRHRLNIAELTKEEHDMYLMGLTMACLGDTDSTVKRKARQRLRTTYVHHGRKVCLSAFLYLENCTLYQLKRIRKHLTIHGVAPRVHGNHGKKPHNVFSLDIYRRATDFLRNFIKEHSNSSGNMKMPVTLPADISRKTIHKKYEKYVRQSAPLGEKLMGYSTFRHFMKEQFPNVRFCKTDIGQNVLNQNLKNMPSTSRTGKSVEPKSQEIEGIPVLLHDNGQTYIVTPVQKIVTSQLLYGDVEEGELFVTDM
ncbi:uncharacterized protein LOC106662204 [Cimex lectularius]|uniref:Uncharacterized protein n=1 Tax=Cimex lectularius TaxID=79782 RepID=A0A8I6RCU3_CIMLE|nr:uncharacterized protein LOC106662204 [Cimex lectularius]